MREVMVGGRVSRSIHAAATRQARSRGQSLAAWLRAAVAAAVAAGSPDAVRGPDEYFSDGAGV